MTNCTFCKIIAGTLSSNKVYETETVLVFAPLKDGIIAKGQLLVVPKRHYENIYDIPKEELFSLMEVIKYVSQKLKEHFKAEGVNILHASGKVAQQSLFHFHFHLIPRYKDDGLNTWPKTDYKDKNFPEFYEKLADLL